jgi:hypothetical protein
MLLRSGGCTPPLAIASPSIPSPFSLPPPSFSLTCQFENTALHMATFKGHNKTVALLCKQEGIDMTIKNKFGQTALDCARETTNICFL